MTDQTTMTMTVGGVTTGPFTADDLEKAVKQIRGGPPMREDSDFKKHNQAAYSVTADELRQFIERFEQLEAEKQDAAGQQKDLMAEAKGRGRGPTVPQGGAKSEAVGELIRRGLMLIHADENGRVRLAPTDAGLAAVSA